MNDSQDILDTITEQVGRYSKPRKVEAWNKALASWTPEVRSWVAQTLDDLKRSELMHTRVAKVVRYESAPANDRDVLVFGERRLGTNNVVDRVNRLMVTLDGRECHKYWDVNGLSTTVKFEDAA